MNGFWLKFTDGSEGYCQGENAYDAKTIAEKLTGKKVEGPQWQGFAAAVIPYPANPIIWQLDHPVTGKCPPFCSTPKQCQGRTSCPKAYACSE